MSIENAPISAPTTADIAEFIQNEYKSLTGVISIPDKGVVWVWSWALASLYILLYRFGNWSFNQIFFSTADAYYKKARGREYGINQGAGLRSTVVVSFTGGTPGAVIPRGTLYKSKATEKLFSTQVEYILSGGTVYVDIQANDSGVEGNLPLATVVELVSPLAGVPTVATVSSLAVEGEDPETDEDYFTRIDTRIKLAPQGGSPGDYFLWSTEVDGVEDILIYTLTSGEVEVYPITEGTLASDKIPSPSDIDRVVDSINTSNNFTYHDRRPIDADVTVKSFGLEGYRVEIDGWAANGGTPSLLTTIEDELRTYFGGLRPEIPQLGKTGAITEVNANMVFTIVNTITQAYATPFTVDDVRTYYIPSGGGAHQQLLPKRSLGVAKLAQYSGVTLDP